MFQAQRLQHLVSQKWKIISYHIYLLWKNHIPRELKDLLLIQGESNSVCKSMILIYETKCWFTLISVWAVFHRSTPTIKGIRMLRRRGAWNWKGNSKIYHGPRNRRRFIQTNSNSSSILIKFSRNYFTFYSKSFLYVYDG